MRLATALVSWVIAAWMCFIFLGSLPYKFTNHPDTQHIFSTLGSWLSGILGDAIGSLFTQFGAYAVGAFELVTALVLMIPAFLWVKSKVSKSDFGTAHALAPTRRSNGFSRNGGSRVFSPLHPIGH
jgi:hypothetical protein